MKWNKLIPKVLDINFEEGFMRLLKCIGFSFLILILTSLFASLCFGLMYLTTKSFGDYGIIAFIGILLASFLTMVIYVDKENFPDKRSLK